MVELSLVVHTPVLLGQLSCSHLELYFLHQHNKTKTSEGGWICGACPSQCECVCVWVDFDRRTCTFLFASVHVAMCELSLTLIMCSPPLPLSKVPSPRFPPWCMLLLFFPPFVWPVVLVTVSAVVITSGHSQLPPLAPGPFPYWF